MRGSSFGGFLFREPEETKVFEMSHLEAAPNDAGEVTMDVQKGSGAKYTSGTLSSTNPLISVAAPKPLSYNMDSRYVFPTKTPSF